LPHETTPMTTPSEFIFDADHGVLDFLPANRWRDAGQADGGRGINDQPLAVSAEFDVDDNGLAAELGVEADFFAGFELDG